MSTTTWIAAVAAMLGAVLGVSLMRTRARLGRLEARTARLEARIEHEIARAISDAHGEARAAGATARRAATAAGVDEPPRRLPFEPVTGPVVRVVAFGAGARRTLVRLAGPRRGRGRARKVA
ncbi:MAG: hypothetical protein MUP97_10125 [Acidimicrobiia bacterium]|jgi:hypothetical protein|nr:hypothetical protein [Acidimicrobiia bacterium]